MKMKFSILIIMLSMFLFIGCTNTSDDKQQNVEESEFTIYTLDCEDTNKVQEFKKINIESDKSVKEKLEILCDALEDYYFKDDSIEIKVESIDKNNIVTINLENEDSWKQHFQGSTGGLITEETIVKTLLQSEYKGEWISGIKILVDDKVPEYDHSFIENTFMR